MSSATHVGNIFLVIGLFPAAISVLVYGLGVTWWRSRWGWHLFCYMAVIAVVLGLGNLRLLIGDSPVFAWIRVAAFGLLDVTLVWRCYFVITAWREGSPDESRGRRRAGHP